MKRGLKVARNAVISIGWNGYNRFPDEKGTESEYKQADAIAQFSYNRFPDEKGTERSMEAEEKEFQETVTTVSPMKRGLKDGGGVHRITVCGCYNRFPDEKGTESSNEQPEPTESEVTTVSPMKRGLKDQPQHHHRNLRGLQPFPR